MLVLSAMWPVGKWKDGRVGVHVGLEVMRSFPQQVRSVILDSVVPAQSRFFENDPTAITRVYRTMFDDCAAEPACARAHPQLEKRFWAFVAKAQKEPVVMRLQDTSKKGTYSVAIFNGIGLARSFWHIFYTTKAISNIPNLMDQLMKGDTQELARLYSSSPVSQDINAGMYNSVECSENEQRFTKTGLEANIQKLDPSVRQDFTLELEDQALTRCKIWNVKPLPARYAEPVSSTIPTLIMEGKYDPVTPPENGMEAAKTLSESFQFLAPSTGHGVFLSGQACTLDALGAWIRQKNLGLLKEAGVRARNELRRCAS